MLDILTSKKIREGPQYIVLQTAAALVCDGKTQTRNISLHEITCKKVLIEIRCQKLNSIREIDG